MNILYTPAFKHTIHANLREIARKVEVEFFGYSMVKKFQAHLYGRVFVLETDHQPMVYVKDFKWKVDALGNIFTIQAIKYIYNVGADFF